MPRTMCATSASGCSFEGLAFTDDFCNRAQSVFDFTEVDVGFVLRCFAERDDADFIFGLRVNYRYRDASKQPERYEPLFTICKAIVFIREGSAFEHARCVNEVEPMVFDIAGALAL